MQTAQYSLITSFSIKDKFQWIYHAYLLSKMYLYKLINNKKYKKYADSLARYKAAGNIKILGHSGVLLALIRGFNKIGEKFLYNKINKNTKYVFLLWLDKKDINKVKKMKKRYPGIIVVSAPTASKTDYDFQFMLPQYDCIDYSWVASNWVKLFYQNKIDKKYWNKIVVCPSGVDVPQNNPCATPIPKHACLCYYKNQCINNKLISELTKRKISVYNIEYGKYSYADYIKTLSHVDFVIFIQDMRETQGLAQAEAWAQNKPTLVHYVAREFSSNSSPYLNNHTGVFYRDFQELCRILDSYTNNPYYFLQHYNAYDWAKANVDDGVVVKKLIKLISGGTSV